MKKKYDGDDDDQEEGEERKMMWICLAQSKENIDWHFWRAILPLFWDIFMNVNVCMNIVSAYMLTLTLEHH